MAMETTTTNPLKRELEREEVEEVAESVAKKPRLETSDKKPEWVLFRGQGEDTFDMVTYTAFDRTSTPDAELILKQLKMGLDLQETSIRPFIRLLEWLSERDAAKFTTMKVPKLAKELHADRRGTWRVLSDEESYGYIECIA